MRLLVSPKDVAEARIAVDGGADIIDVKNPAEGSLGANFPWVIREVKKILPEGRELSATIGDFPNLPGTASLAAVGAVSCGVDYVKVGLKGARSLKEGIALAEAVARAVKDEDAGVKVVCCGYADYERVGSVDVSSIPEIAKSAGADYAMIDTALKDGRSLLDFLSKRDVSSFIEESHGGGLLVALGGSISINDLGFLKEVGVDVVGVRGAVCENDRGSVLSLEKVRLFSKALKG